MGLIVVFASAALGVIAALAELPMVAVASLGISAVALVNERLTKAALKNLDEGGGWPALEREMVRQRRHGRSLTLCRLQVGSGLRPEGVASKLNPALRDHDVAFGGGKDVVYVVLPECDAHSARVPAERVRAILAEIGVGGVMSLATYPDDGLTVSALISHASSSEARTVGSDAQTRPAHNTPESKG